MFKLRNQARSNAKTMFADTFETFEYIPKLIAYKNEVMIYKYHKTKSAQNVLILIFFRLSLELLLRFDSHCHRNCLDMPTRPRYDVYMHNLDV